MMPGLTGGQICRGLQRYQLNPTTARQRYIRNTTVTFRWQFLSQPLFMLLSRLRLRPFVTLNPKLRDGYAHEKADDPYNNCAHRGSRSHG